MSQKKKHVQLEGDLRHLDRSSESSVTNTNSFNVHETGRVWTTVAVHYFFYLLFGRIEAPKVLIYNVSINFASTS